MALKALYDCGVGGHPMRWAAIQAIGKKISDDTICALFTAVREYVFQGKSEEAVEWVKELQDIYM
jgi:hypothetical protein